MMNPTDCPEETSRLVVDMMTDKGYTVTEGTIGQDKVWSFTGDTDRTSGRPVPYGLRLDPTGRMTVWTGPSIRVDTVDPADVYNWFMTPKPLS
ncbi:MAG: hypothetical protein ACRBK7_14470 [Acidimicrobiales bacterium]